MSLVSFAFELVTASTHDGSHASYVAYVEQRLAEEAPTPDETHKLITLLASVAGFTIAQWAADTDRSADEVLQLIALGVMAEE